MKRLLLSLCAMLCVATFTLRGQAIDAETYFDDLTPVGDGWYYDDVFGFIYPLGVPWYYVYSLDSAVAITGTDAQNDVHYTWDSNLGWGFISLETGPWIYFFDTDGMIADLESVEPGWYYSLGLASGGNAPFSYFSAELGSTVSTQLVVEIINGTGAAPGPSKVDPKDIYVTVYGSTFTSSNGPTPGQSVAMGQDRYSFTTTDFESGRIFISYRGKMPDEESKIDPFSNSIPRNDKVEITYQLKNGAPTGSANLTAVDYFGIPMMIETLDASGNVLATFTYYANLDTVVKGLDDIDNKIATDAKIMKGNEFLRVVAPVKWAPGSGAPTANPYPSMKPYFDSVSGQSVNIVGQYDGVPGQYSPAAYNYTGTLASSGDITFSGTLATNGGAPAAGDNIVIKATDLLAGIYTANPPYTKGGASGQISDNDVYSAIVRDLLTGFNAGYIGGTYGSDPSDEWWSKPPFQEQGGDKYYNQYAAVIQEHSQAYGFPFSDRLRNQLAFFNQDTATLRITLLPDTMLNAPLVTVKSKTDTSITLQWDEVSNASGYDITYYPPLAGTSVSVDKGSTTSKEITGLDPGTPYTFYVTAIDNSSGTKYTSPPYQLTASTNGNAPQVTGPGQWQANFLLPNGVAQDGDLLIVNNITGILDTTGNLSYTNQRVSSLTMNSAGSGYSNSTTVKLSGGGGFNATASPVLDGTQGISAVFVDNSGFGYSSPPTVSFENVGSGSGASYTAVLTSSNVTFLPIPCKLNAQNAYVLTWKRGDEVLFQSMLYVDVKGYADSSNPASNGGLVEINPETSKTFLEGNRFLPTVGSGQNDDWNLFLTIQPAEQP